MNERDGVVNNANAVVGDIQLVYSATSGSLHQSIFVAGGFQDHMDLYPHRKQDPPDEETLSPTLTLVLRFGPVKSQPM
jgi:hypothetical protein